MSNDKQKLDLEGLLAEVEHAGRDARRRDEIGAMIDSMANVGKHGFWWWTVRVAAAACIIFFIGTAVRIWVIPTDSTVNGNVVAQAEVLEVEPSSSSPKIGEGDHCEAVGEEYDTEAPAPVALAVREEIIEMPFDEEEYIAEEQPADTVLYSAPLAELGISSPSLGKEQDSVVTDVETIVAPIVSVGNTHVATAEEHKPKRESIFKNLFRPAEPSLMEGTTLALLQF